MKEDKSNNSLKILVIVLIVLILVAGVLLGLKIWQDYSSTEEEATEEILETEVVEEEEEVKLPTTLSGTSRPVAVMIDNNINAMPQAGLEAAAIVYEMIVEGGETRLMLILDSAEDLEQIGPIRSSRHYFLDYALENDAIYVHYGWSPQAKSDITSLGVDNINGITESSSSFWRVSSRSSPHNVVTTMENILTIAERKGYSTTSTADTVLNYVVEEVTLEEGEDAYTVTIPYSTSNTVEYIYDEDTQEYVRYSRNTEQTDWNTGNTVTTKNIIITFVENSSMDSYGRQTLDNIGTLDGYYITNGKAIPITCTKTSRSSQTVYRDLEGNEIDVNDGKTFIQLCPIDSEVEIVGNSTETEIEE